MPQLFTPPEREQVNGRMAVTKSGEGVQTPTATYEHELLAEQLTQKRMMELENEYRLQANKN